MSMGLKGAGICLAVATLAAALIWAVTGSLGWAGMIWTVLAFGLIPVVDYYIDPVGWREGREEIRRMKVK